MNRLPRAVQIRRLYEAMPLKNGTWDPRYLGGLTVHDLARVIERSASTVGNYLMLMEMRGIAFRRTDIFGVVRWYRVPASKDDIDQW